MKTIEIPVPEWRTFRPWIVPLIAVSLAFVGGMKYGGRNHSAPSVPVSGAVSEFLAAPLEHYHGQRTAAIAVGDAVETFVLNASPVLRLPDVPDSVPTVQPAVPDPAKKDPPPPPPRRRFLRR